jgi:hypothetical protein
MFASGLPPRVTSEMDLKGWDETPVVSTYERTLDNWLGITSLNLKYAVTFQHGGRYRGRGLYLAHIAVIPLTADVKWGSDFNMDVAVSNVINVGKNQPIAQALVTVQYSITGVAHKMKSDSFHVRGDGTITPLYVHAEPECDKKDRTCSLW